jgi:hypothetical protein
VAVLGVREYACGDLQSGGRGSPALSTFLRVLRVLVIWGLG